MPTNRSTPASSVNAAAVSTAGCDASERTEVAAPAPDGVGRPRGSVPVLTSGHIRGEGNGPDARSVRGFPAFLM